MSIDEIRKNLLKNVKGVHCSVMSDSIITKTGDLIKTPSLDLNRILSGNLFGGIPSRNLVGITGPEHTGKSSFAVLCAAEAIRKGYTIIFIDTEGGAKNDFCKRWGLDISKVLHIYTPWISKIMSVLASLKESGDQKMYIILDSVGGIDKYGSYETALNDDPKADQGQLQRQIRGMLKLFLNICIEQDSIGIVTSHMYGRPPINGISMPDEVSGGKAMKLFPSILIQLKKTPMKDKEKNIIGNTITATTIKNRHYPPFQSALISLDYINGINQYAGILDLGVTAGLVEQSGAWYSYNGERLGQGAENASKGLSKFPKLLEDINKWLMNTGYSNVDNLLKQAEEIVVGTDAFLPEEETEEQVHYVLGKEGVVDEIPEVEPVVVTKPKRAAKKKVAT